MTTPTTDNERRDLFAEGWLVGIKQARAIVHQAEGRADAIRRLERLLAEDHRSRKVRR